MSGTLERLIADKRILVCVGSGGVGKTTTAATVGMCAARAGRRTLVMTIDPAKRLANALGLASLDHEPRPVPDDKLAAIGVPASGCLHAMMLHQKRAFDEIVAEHAKDAAQVERIKANRIYQQISSTLTGSHEYAAMAKLYDVARTKHGERYDLIVLDTPPTANALDFLDAPSKLVNAIDSPALQWFLRPYFEGKSFSYNVVGFWGASVLKRLARFVGSRFLEDMAQFLGEFNQVLGGFRQRASDVIQLLHRAEVAFLVVCSPQQLSVDEALYFHERIRTQAMLLGAFICNRVHPRGPEAPSRADLVEHLEGRRELRGLPPDDIVQIASDVGRTYAEFQTLAAIDARQIERLHEAAPSATTIQVPLFDRDVYDIEALSLVAKHLLA